MGELTFYKDYKHNDKLRKSFNELATSIFGIDFEEWYQAGFWNNRYIPFSFIDKEKVVANVSVNLLDVITNGENKRAIQIGTVMTHSDYRGRGLSAALMNKVLEAYEGQNDFMYLFANKNVLNFYPKFGFQRVKEYQYFCEYSPGHSDLNGVRKLDGKNSEDLHFIYEFASDRIPVSQLFGTQHAQGILMFYCLYVFSDNIYYLEKEDAMVICKHEGSRLEIFDIISKKEVNIKPILLKITARDTNKIVFHYTPDYKEIDLQSHILHDDDDVLFVRTNGTSHFPLHSKHPLTSQA